MLVSVQWLCINVKCLWQLLQRLEEIVKLVSSPAVRRESEHFIVDSVYFTSIVFLYRVQCLLYKQSAYYTMYSVYFTSRVVSRQCTVFTIQVEWLLYNGHCLIIGFNIQWIVFIIKVECTLYSGRYSLYSRQCLLYK